MIKKTWALALYNVKKTYSNLEDLQSMFDVAFELDYISDPEEKVKKIKDWLFDQNKLNDETISRLFIDSVLVSHLNKLETFINSYSANFNDKYLGDVIEKIRLSHGKFIVELDDNTVDYRNDDDEEFDKKAFMETIDELSIEVSLKSVLEFVYKNRFDKVSYSNITGNKTEFNDIMIVKPILECLVDPKLQVKFSNYQLAEFFYAFVSNNKNDVEYLKTLLKYNNEYVKLDGTVLAKFEKAVSVLDSNFKTPDNFLMNKIDENLSVVDLNVLSDELYKIYKGNGIDMKTLKDVYNDFIDNETTGHGNFNKIKNSDQKNRIIELLKEQVYDLVSKYINFAVKCADKITEYNEQLKITRVKVAGDRLLTSVIEKWHDFICVMKKNSAYTENLKRLEEDFKKMQNAFDDDKFVYQFLKPGISYVDLISKIDMFEPHFFDSVLEFMKDEVKNTPKYSVETKIDCEKEVLHLMSVLFNVPFNAKSEYEEYSKCALIVYGYVKQN